MRHIHRVRRRALERAHALADMRVLGAQRGDGGDTGHQHQAQLLIAALKLQRLPGAQAINIKADIAPTGIFRRHMLDAPFGVRRLTFGKQ